MQVQRTRLDSQRFKTRNTLKKTKMCIIIYCMKYILMIIMASISLIGSSEIEELHYDIPESDWQYCYRLARKYTDKKTSKRIADVVKRDSFKYRLPGKWIANQIEVEGQFYPRAKSHKDAIGLMQIRWFYYTNKLYKLDNGKLGKHLRRRRRQGKPVYYTRYFKRIGYNIEMGCDIMSDLIKKYDNYGLALIAYVAGESSDRFRACRKNPEMVTNYRYVRRIMR